MAFYRNFCRIFCGGLFALSLFLPQNMFGDCNPGYLHYFGGTEKCPSGCFCPGQSYIHLNSDEKKFCSGTTNDIRNEGDQKCQLITSGTYSGLYGCTPYGYYNTCTDLFYRCPDGFPNSAEGSDSYDDCSAEGFAFYYNGATHFRYNSTSIELNFYSAVANVCYYNKTCSPSSTTSTGSAVKASDLRQAGYRFTGGWGTSSSCSGSQDPTITDATNKNYYACKQVCPAGKYASVEMSTNTCGAITAGYFSTGGAKTPTPTSNGDCVGDNTCGLVAGGYYNTGLGKNATGGLSSSANPSTYSGGIVAAGYYSTGGGTRATPTASGNGCVSSKSCGKLSNGYYSTGGATGSQPTGHVADDATNKTNKCVGKDSDNNETVCGACGNNAHSSDDRTYCICDDGYSLGGGYSRVTSDATNNRSANNCALKKYNIKFSGTNLNSKDCDHGVSCALPTSETTFYNAGHRLVGWSTGANGTGTTYGTGTETVYTGTFTGDNEQTYNGSTFIPLYPVWEKCKGATYHMGQTGTAANVCTACPTPPNGWEFVQGIDDDRYETGLTSYTSCQIRNTNDITNCKVNGYVLINAANANNYNNGTIDASHLEAEPGCYKKVNGTATSCEICANGYVSGGGDVTSCTNCISGDNDSTNSDKTQCLNCGETEVGKFIDGDKICRNCSDKIQTYDSNIYTFLSNLDTTNKSVSGCAVKLTGGNCDIEQTKDIIYKYDTTKNKYIRQGDIELSDIVPKEGYMADDQLMADDYLNADYCKGCKDYEIYENGKCVACGMGHCVDSSDNCIDCPAGKECKSTEKLFCDNAQLCKVNTFSEQGYVGCVACAAGYSTVLGAALSDNICANTDGTGCISPAACIMMTPKLCFVPSCIKPGVTVANLTEGWKSIYEQKFDDCVVQKEKCSNWRVYNGTKISEIGDKVCQKAIINCCRGIRGCKDKLDETTYGFQDGITAIKTYQDVVKSATKY